MEADYIEERGEVKWFTILQRLFYDVFLLGFGAWIIWKQVEAVNPNVFLGAIGFGMIFPAARSAIISVWSGAGSSSPGTGSSSPSSQQLPQQESSPSSGGTGDKP